MKTQKQTQWAAPMAALFLAAAEALAQDQSSTLPEDSGEESRRRIIVSLSDRKLAVLEDGRLLKVYPTAVGADATPSPTGTFKIANRVPNPTWYGPNRQVVPPGKANPLGTRWMGLNRKGYGIHGTNNPRSIGHSASHGCIRMRKTDVEELFELVKIGDIVEFVAQPTDSIAWIFSADETILSAE